MRTFRFALVAMVLWGTAFAAEEAPSPVAERITTHLGRTTRVSLFSNHVVVVSIRSETEDFVHRATLEYDEYMIYLRVLEEAAMKIGDNPVISAVESRESITTLVLHVGPDAPRIFRYSPLSSLGLSIGQIASAMDDVQDRALNTLPGEHELRHWVPEVGDCVELRLGGEACVSAIEENGTIELRRSDILMTYTVARENRAETILRVLEPEP